MTAEESKSPLGDDRRSSGQPTDYQRQKDRISEVCQQWQRSRAPNAAAFLADHPSVACYPSLVIDLAYEEYFLRREEGERVDVSAFCEQFPIVRRELMECIQTDEYARRNLIPQWNLGHQAWPEPGDRLFDGRVEEVIGQGAFARVYLCSQEQLGGRQAVAKVTFQALPEAEVLGRLNHPNIVPIYDQRQDPQTGVHSLWMPFVGRSTLRELIQFAFANDDVPRRASVILDAARCHIRPGDRYHSLAETPAIPPDATYVDGVVIIARQIAEALHHAHQRGVIHGDLKPSNVVLTNDATPLLVDFNLAFGHPACSALIGWTVPYVAPERLRAYLLQADPQQRVDERSDVYAFGCLLYELLTGRVPFEVDLEDPDREAMAGRLLDAQATSVGAVGLLHPDADSQLSQLVQQCLQFDPQRRPTSMAVVLDQLPSAGFGRNFLARRIRRYRRTTLVLLLALAIVPVLFFLSRMDPVPRRQRQFELGVQEFKRGELRKSIETFTKSIVTPADSADPYLARAAASVHLFLIDGEEELLENAVRDLRFAARLRDDPEIQCAKAYCHIRSRQPEMASSVLRRVLAENYESATVWNNLAYCVMLLAGDHASNLERYEQEIEKAEQALRRARKLDPQMYQPHLNLAILELERFRMTDGQYVPQEGLAAIREVIRLNPEDAATFFFAAKLAGIVAETDSSPDLIEECLTYLEQAYDRGHDLGRHSATLSDPFRRLEGIPRFQALLRRPRPTTVRTAADRTVMPVALAEPPTAIKSDEM